MFLTEASVLHYLARRGFAGFDSVTGGAYAVRVGTPGTYRVVYRGLQGPAVRAS